MEEENEKNYCTLYLVRHGETEWNAKKVNQGQSESFLTEKGIQQGKETAERLKNISFSEIFSSDMVRTQKTAEIIKLDREIIIQTSKLLRERSYGRFEGKHFDVLKNTLKDKLKERENLPENKYSSFRLAPDIETDEEVVSRFLIKIREIAVAYPKKNVLVVSHAGCIKNFLIKIDYIERKALLGWHFENGGYVKVLSDGVNFFVKEVWGIKKRENKSE
jgi:broad specificity phosphatase PhoE